MPRTMGEIFDTIQQRRIAETPLIRRMIDVQMRYNGDLVLPFPDVDGDPMMKPPVPNIIAEAVDMGAQRANSLPLSITAPPKNSTDPQRAIANTRRRALYGRWHESQLNLKRYRAYRHLIGYGTFSMIVLPDRKDGHARIELRDPLSAYPELRWQDDIREPLDCGFVFARSAGWIRDNFAHKAGDFINNATKKGRDWDTLWDCVEWIDADEIVLGVLGPRQVPYGGQDSRMYGNEAYELDRYPNKAGCVPVVSPRRLTMDRVQGQLSSLIETSDLFGRVAALDLMAMERAIFPDLVIISRTGAPPTVYSGDWQDGRSGNPNILSDVTVQSLQSSQGPGGAQVIETLERGLRSTGGSFGPSDAAGARSGSQVDSLAALAADPRMIESQRIMEQSHVLLNEYIQAVEKGYAEPKKKFFLFSGNRGDLEPVEYEPAVTFAFTPTMCDYPFVGLDAAQLNVATVQLQGSHVLSRRSARGLSPFVADSDQEEAFEIIEGLNDSILAGMQTQAAQDPNFLPVVAHVQKLVQDGKSLGDALTDALAVVAQKQAPPPGGATPPDDGSGLTPDQSRMLAAAGQTPGAQASVPPPAAGLTNAQKLSRAISAQPSQQAV